MVIGIQLSLAAIPALVCKLRKLLNAEPILILQTDQWLFNMFFTLYQTYVSAK